MIMEEEKEALLGLMREDNWVSDQQWQYANDQLARSLFDDE